MNVLTRVLRTLKYRSLVPPSRLSRKKSVKGAGWRVITRTIAPSRGGMCPINVLLHQCSTNKHELIAAKDVALDTVATEASSCQVFNYVVATKRHWNQMINGRV